MNCADCEHSIAEALYLWCGHDDVKGIGVSDVPCIPVCPANGVPAWCPVTMPDEETLYATMTDTDVGRHIERLDVETSIDDPVDEFLDYPQSQLTLKFNEVIRKLNRLMKIVNTKW